MSTSETVTFELGSCPCGSGKVIESITTQDNPWSGADITHYIECSVCISRWRISYGFLVDIKTENDSRRAMEYENLKLNELKAICAPLVDAYFSNFAARSKKAEYEEMMRLKIYTGSYRNYLDDKSRNRSWADIAYALRNENWVERLADCDGLGAAFRQARKALQDARDAANVAGRAVVRLPLPKQTYS